MWFRPPASRRDTEATVTTEASGHAQHYRGLFYPRSLRAGLTAARRLCHACAPRNRKHQSRSQASSTSLRRLGGLRRHLRALRLCHRRHPLASPGTTHFSVLPGVWRATVTVRGRWPEGAPQRRMVLLPGSSVGRWSDRQARPGGSARVGTDRRSVPGLAAAGRRRGFRPPVRPLGRTARVLRVCAAGRRLRDGHQLSDCPGQDVS